ncbi:MAG: hypothetical protein L0Z70_12830 [Chloroflexi bacterium]|nr:hypothetical protein [Chloroflexota bacterium]
MFIVVMGGLILSACAARPAWPAGATATPPAQPAPYPDLGAAPELRNETWLNTPEPLRLADLRGKVVLVDMWTFG